MKKINLIIILTILIQLSWAQETVQINKWKITNPQKINMPAFSDIKNIDGDTFEESKLLNTTQIDLNSKSLTWKNIEISSDSIVLNQISENNLVLLSSYLSVDQWTQGSLNINMNAYFEVYADNKLVKTKSNADLSDNKIKLDLQIGNHEIKIKAISSEENLKLIATFEYDEAFIDCNATSSLNPNRYFTINDLMNSKNASASISASGKYVLINYSERTGDEGKSKSYSVIYDFTKQKNITVLRNKNIANLSWLPRTDRLTYSVDFEEKVEIFVYDIISGNEKSIAKGIENLSRYSWSPSEDFIIYSDNITAEKLGELKRIFGNDDRLPNFRDRSYLHKIDVYSGNVIQLTTGNLSSSLHDIKPDGSKILISTSRMDYTEVPFRKQNLYEMDIKTFELTTIWEDKIYSGNASYSPDGNKLLVESGPECFGNIGVNISEGRIPNVYDSQLYIYDLLSKKVESITKDFDPSISSAYWSNNNQIYVSVTEKDYKNLYKYNFKTKAFTKINLQVEMLGRIDYAYNKNFAVYKGTSISTPIKLYSLDLKKGTSTLLSFPDKEKFADIKFGTTEPWNFTNKNGTTIYGRVYYPPNYDATKKYPVIVNFYGGTSPIGRSFGGRYPINIWAASNYIVYVLQPSGATGFGQDFSALHVNGWGFDAIDDIIDGTKKFLEAHPTTDSENVGCIGASYGGFTTMLLQTRTDIFKTAISHAGISSLTSYWGEGYWGYSYNTVAAKNSYPWDRKDIYVENSPIYNANKFQNSILLLHGTADTNVPVGESLQYYAALKILGKDVEMVLVEDQNHWILDYKKRIEWHYTIMSWFDKKLKDQSQQWDDMFPEKNL
ncbi:MAG: S9 family peptidase [Bacteroidales bacterium]|jgi:dipeptidyl aminopeptidase/acylaminoacyl peptidase|nr:S9 family peptidase [Bacteroidales bacterium]